MIEQKTKDAVFEALRKRFGADFISNDGHDPIEAIPTGCPALDLALGTGGIPRGHVTEIYGDTAVGKSTLAMHVIAQAQKAGLDAALIAAEPMLTADYLKAIGVGLDTLTVIHAGCLEHALEAIEDLARANWPLIVVDSVASLCPIAEVEGDMGDWHENLPERRWDQAQRKLSHVIPHSQTALVLVNQLREKPGVLFGNPFHSVAAQIIGYWASVRMHVYRVEAIKVVGEVAGMRMRVQVKKNRLARPFTQVEFPVIYGHGIVSEEAVKEYKHNFRLEADDCEQV